MVSARLAGAVVVRARPAVRCPSAGRWPGGRQPRLIAVRWRDCSARTPHTGGPPTSVPQAPRRHRGGLFDPGRPRPSTRPGRGWAVGRRTVCRPQGAGRAEPLRGTRSRQWGSAFGRPGTRSAPERGPAGVLRPLRPGDPGAEPIVTVKIRTGARACLKDPYSSGFTGDPVCVGRQHTNDEPLRGNCRPLAPRVRQEVGAPGVL